jgi:hypothetical protein
MKVAGSLQAGIPTAYLSHFAVLTPTPVKQCQGYILAKCTEVSLTVNLPHEDIYGELSQLSAKHASNLTG